MFSDGLFFLDLTPLVRQNSSILRNPTPPALLLEIMKAERRPQIGITKGFDGNIQTILLSPEPRLVLRIDKQLILVLCQPLVLSKELWTAGLIVAKGLWDHFQLRRPLKKLTGSAEFVVVARPAEQLQHLHWRPAHNIALTEEEVFRSDTYTSHVSTNLLSGHGPESSRFYCSTYLRIVASDNCPGLLNAAFSFCEPRAGLAVSALHLVCAFFRNSSLPWWVKPEHELKEAARQGIKRAADTNDTTS